MSYADMGPTPSRSRHSVVLILFAIIGVAAGVRWLTTSGSTESSSARVMILNGVGTLTRSDGSTVPDIGAGETVVVESGDKIATGAGSNARLSFGGDQSIDIGPTTRLTILDLSTGFLSQAPVITLALHGGMVKAQIDELPLGSPSLSIETNVITMITRGGSVQCDALSQEHVYIAVYAGEATVSMGEQMVRLAAGQSLDAYLGQALVPEKLPGFVATPSAPLTAAPETIPPSWDERNRTLFPPIVTPTRPGDAAGSIDYTDTRTYVVQPGDTLYSIARDVGISWEDIWRANQSQITSPDQIRVGQTLIIPVR